MTSPLEEQIQSSLDNSLHDIDAETRQQLQTIRRDALKQPIHGNWLRGFNQWAPIAGIAICCMLVISIWMAPMQSTNELPKMEQMAIVELMENPEDFDMLSDPSFYLWMDELEAQDV